MSVCTGGIMIVQAFILLLGMEAFLFAGKSGLHIGHNNKNLFNSIKIFKFNIEDIRLRRKHRV